MALGFNVAVSLPNRDNDPAVVFNHRSCTPILQDYNISENGLISLSSLFKVP